MGEYRDPENNFSLDYPEDWLPLTHEGSPHVSLASLSTGGYLKVEAYQFPGEQPADGLRPERTLERLIEAEKRSHPELEPPPVQVATRSGAEMAYASFLRQEKGPNDGGDFGFARSWVFRRGDVQVRCLYRCRAADRGEDDDELERIIGSLVINDVQHLTAEAFAKYYYSLLRHYRPHLEVAPPQDLSLTLPDGQTILLEHLYNHYLLETARLDELIEAHISRLDYCGDDVPDLTCYAAVKKLLFPKLFAAPAGRPLPAHRVAFWPGLAIGAVIQGRVFTYGVNLERLAKWGKDSLRDIHSDLLDNLYNIPPISPRGLRTGAGVTQAISYVDHAFSASFVLFEDFYQTTAHNLGTGEFLVGLPDPSCVSCFRDDDPRFVVKHTALLRWDYHRSVERLTDTIYLVAGPGPADAKPYDILHCCVKKA